MSLVIFFGAEMLPEVDLEEWLIFDVIYAAHCWECLVFEVPVAENQLQGIWLFWYSSDSNGFMYWEE